MFLIIADSEKTEVKDLENMINATGAKSYFAEILVTGELKKDYSPVRGEKIKNK